MDKVNSDYYSYCFTVIVVVVDEWMFNWPSINCCIFVVASAIHELVWRPLNGQSVWTLVQGQIAGQWLHILFLKSNIKIIITEHFLSARWCWAIVKEGLAQGPYTVTVQGRRWPNYPNQSDVVDPITLTNQLEPTNCEWRTCSRSLHSNRSEEEMTQLP